MADFIFWTLVADFRFWTLASNFEFWTLVHVAVVRFWTLLPLLDFGRWSPFTGFGH